MIRFGVTSQGYEIAKEAGAIFNPEVDVVIAREECGHLLGGVVYQSYTGASIGMHTAGFVPRWLSRDLLWVSFHYVFVQLQCNRAFVEIRSCNLKGLEFASKLGFKEVTRVEGVYPDGDLVVMRMLREECKWLGITPRAIAAGAGLNGQEV